MDIWGSGSFIFLLGRSVARVGEGSTILVLVERRAFLMIFELGCGSSPILRELIILFRASRFCSLQESSFSLESGFLSAAATVLFLVGEKTLLLIL